MEIHIKIKITGQINWNDYLILIIIIIVIFVYMSLSIQQ